MSADTGNPIHPVEDGHDGIIEKTSLNNAGEDINDLSARTFIVDLSSASDDPADARGAKQVGLLATDESSVCTSDSESVHTPVHPPGLRDDTADLKTDVDNQVEAAETILTPTLDASENTVKPLTDAPNACLLETQIEEQSYSLSGLHRLDTFIPDDLLPDDLLVHDIDNITHPESSQPHPHLPIRYVRILPKTPRENAFHGRDANAHVRVAHLYLKHSNTLGTGHHGAVYRAPLRLRLDADSQEERTVSVAVKTAHNECGAHYMLNNEARMYAALPRSFMEDRRVLPEEAESQPVGVVCEQGKSALKKVDNDNGKVDVSSDSDGESPSGSDPPTTAWVKSALPFDLTATKTEAKVEAGADVAVAQKESESTDGQVPGVFEPAVVPKFYGYYAALNADGTLREDTHTRCGEDNTCAVSWPTRLLLVEECGAPLSGHSFSRQEVRKCLALVERLHEAGILHGSTYVRNMLVQPGPLSAPRDKRSMEHPSFRLIDLGRSEFAANFSERYREQVRWDELQRTKRQLGLLDSYYYHY